MSMFSQNRLLSAVADSSILVCSSFAEEVRSTPNVLFISIDDLNDPDNPELSPVKNRLKEAISF